MRKGFTLIELLVVIAIIGLLSTIVIASLTSSKAKGRDAKRVADIRTIQLAMESYFNDNGFYPTALSSVAPTYIGALPKDPSNNSTNYFYSAYNASGTANCTTNKPIRYHLAATMESNDTTNSSLTQDADSTTVGQTPCTGTTNDFHGNAANCSGSSAALTDNCYDQIN
jgi:type II secretion system protein G